MGILDFIKNESEKIWKILKVYGGYSVDRELIDLMVKLVPSGTLLEFGSGRATEVFSKYYTVYSVEENPEWLNKYNSNYIHAPIKNGWYDREVLEKKLPSNYDVILIDGPTSPEDLGRLKIRQQFLTNIDLFNTKVVIFVDDIHREAEASLLNSLSEMLGRPATIVEARSGAKFGYL
ncbi:hypothetical protein OAI71_00020 [Marine Group III euryarchaeote]|nr:hypothetical protein [Marine Group III euryarchaeote]|tara:strand:- start:2301 stop:2831 length:531 start_codon:yes stop_codon:yes gene_type:complete